MAKKVFRKIIIFGAVVLLLISTIGPTLSVKVTQSISKNNFDNFSETDPVIIKDIVVPDDYQTIQDAINNASTGDNIRVKEGVYNENIVIHKSVNIRGEGYRHTVINGLGDDDTVKITADGVELSYFSIQNSCSECSGIFVDSHFNTITMNNITSNGIGIFLDISDGNIIRDNMIVYNQKGGIKCYNSRLNEILKNEVSNNGEDGMIIDTSSTNNQLYGNIANKNGENGTIINQASRSNLLVGNNISGNSIGVLGLGGSDSNVFHHNTFVGNTINAFDSSNDIWNSQNKGNHWNDYLGEDLNGDGIGDTPYNISGGDNQDEYPLTLSPQPGIPVIDGPNDIKTGKVYEFHIYTPEENQVYDEVFYEIYWDDGAPWEPTSEMVNTSEGTYEKHTWYLSGLSIEKEYKLTARAYIDYEGIPIPSGISQPFVIKVTKSRNSYIKDINDIDVNIRDIYNRINRLNQECDIVVPRDFETIQEAIDNADNDSKICVWSGTYFENIIIHDKSLIIIGNGSDSTIIFGDNIKNNVVTIEKSSNVIFSGFCIKGGYNAGIWMDDTQDCIIQDNIFDDEGSNSLLIFYSLNISIIDNNFYKCGLGIYGNILDHFIQNVFNNLVNNLELFYAKNQKNVYLWGEEKEYGSIILVNCTNFVIDSFDTLKDTYSGIELSYCSEIDIKNSEYISSNQFGIYVYNCDIGIKIYDNNISKNGLYGIYVRESSALINDNVIHNNYYGITLWESSGNFIHNNDLFENEQAGIYLHFSHFNQIGSDNWIHKNVNGLNIISSTFNNIHNNTIEKNSYDGIFLKNASNNTIISNNIEHNAIYGTEHDVRNGIELKENSCCNRIEYNFISYQKFWGIMIYDNSNENIIIHNVFYFNGFFWDFIDRHAYDSCSNIWDNGYPDDYEDFTYIHGITNECGNCWSHFLTVDIMRGPNQNIPDPLGDNVSDVTYTIPGGSNVEKYPIMQFFPDDETPPELHPIFPNPGFLHISPIINWDWPLRSTFVIFYRFGENVSLQKLKFKVNAYEPVGEDFQSNLVRVNFTLINYRTDEKIYSDWINYNPLGDGYVWDLTNHTLFGKYKLEIVAMDTAGNAKNLEIDPVYIIKFN